MKLQTSNFAAGSRMRYTKQKNEKLGEKGRGLRHVTYFWILGPPYYLRFGWSYRRHVLQPDRGWGILNKIGIAGRFADVINCDIFWQSVQGFVFSMGPKFAISDWLSPSPLTQCWRYRAKLDSCRLLVWPILPTNNSVGKIMWENLSGILSKFFSLHALKNVAIEESWDLS